MQVGTNATIQPTGNDVDFDVWYAEWIEKSESMARRMGIEDPSAAAAEVMVIFWTKGYLDQWNPHGGRNLNTFTYEIVQLRLRTILTSQKRRRTHEEPRHFDYGTSDNWEDDGGTVEPGAEDEHLSVVESLDTASAIVDMVADLDDSPSVCAPRYIIVEMAKSCLTGDSPVDREIAERLDVPVTTYRPHRRNLASLLKDTDARELLGA